MIYLSAASITKDLINLHQAKTQKEYIWERYYPDSNSMSLSRLLDYHNLQLNRPFFLYSTLDLARDYAPEWKANLLREIESINESGEIIKRFPTMSTVLSTRGRLVEVLQYEGSYIIFGSSSKDDIIDIHRAVLAVLILENQDDKAFVDRLSSSLANGSDFILTDEEKELLKEYEQQKEIRTIKRVLTDLLSPQRPFGRISAIKSDLQQYNETIQRLLGELRELQLKDFAIEQGLLKLDLDTEEFDEYLMSISDNIMSIVTEGRSLYITIATYMRLDSSDKDFIKPEVIARKEHPLYNKEKATDLLIAGINQKIRIPIIATYKITQHSSGALRLDGVEVPDDFYGLYANNTHVQVYNCFDGYKRQALDALDQQDIIAFFEILIQCTGTVNLFESPTNRDIVRSLQVLNPQTVLQVQTETADQLTGRRGWVKKTLKEYTEDLAAKDAKVSKPEEEDDNEIN